MRWLPYLGGATHSGAQRADLVAHLHVEYPLDVEYPLGDPDHAGIVSAHRVI